MKKQTTEWEKIFVNHVFNKGEVSRIYKELYSQQQRQKLKDEQRTNRHFSRENTYIWPTST